MELKLYLIYTLFTTRVVQGGDRFSSGGGQILLQPSQLPGSEIGTKS